MATDVPLIDIESARHGSSEQREAMIADIVSAAEHFGAFRVVGHGIPKEPLRHARDDAWSFFGQPDEDKRKILALTGLGYQPRPDMSGKESISTISPSEVLLFTRNREQNSYPEHPPSFRESVDIFVDSMEHLAGELVRLLAAGLGHAESRFDADIEDSLSFLRLAHYLHLDGVTRPGEFRSAPHRDDGTLTILYVAKEAAGLEIADKAGTWFPVVPVPGSLVVLIGRLMGEWSAGRYVAALHRVVNPAPRGDDNSRLVFVYCHSPRCMASTVDSYIRGRAAYVRYEERARAGGPGIQVHWDSDVLEADTVTRLDSHPPQR